MCSTVISLGLDISKIVRLTKTGDLTTHTFVAIAKTIIIMQNLRKPLSVLFHKTIGKIEMCFLTVAALLVLLDKGQVLVDVISGADYEGHPLVERFGLYVQYPLSAGGGEASRLLDEESDGVALVQQAQLWGEKLKENTVKVFFCWTFLLDSLLFYCTFRSCLYQKFDSVYAYKE